MKGHKLTLQEVLNLEDGSKVWVEDSRRGYTNELCSYKKEDNILLVISDNTNYILDVIEVYENKLEFYEWTSSYSNLMMLFEEDDDSDILRKMSVEICNLRGLDLTDGNIRLIVEEFSR